MSMWLTEKPPREKPSAPNVSVVTATPLITPEADGIVISATAEQMNPVGINREGERERSTEQSRRGENVEGEAHLSC